MVNTDDLLKIPYFEEQVFSYYCKGFKIGKTIKSPFRTEKTPSFGIYKTSYKCTSKHNVIIIVILFVRDCSNNTESG